MIFLEGMGTIYGLWAQGRATSPEQSRRLAVANSRVRMGWWLIVVFTIAWWWGQASLVVVFAIFSFFLLREFIALTPIKHTDHWVLVIAFYIAIPVQYALVYFNLTQIFTLFIPIYLFLILPVIAAMSHDTDRYLERVAKVQWGLMICVFCVSHAPAIATLDFGSHKTSGELMLLFFLIITFLADLFSVLMSSLLGGKAVAMNSNKSVKGIAAGSTMAVVAGVALYWLTPFSILQTALYALAIVVSCLLGDMVITSVKRSLGSRSWEGELYIGRGILERFAPLTFAAPVFYHLTVLFQMLHIP
ncbi:MAG: phosphatidate cytidylyltransferase [Sutterellaceae bacterium]|nr:phosphatidate cytidylyltransferase [Sutterellaceae bacterium]